MSWYLHCWRQYAEFDGRASRKEFWLFFLFYIVIFVALLAVDGLIGVYSHSLHVGALSGIYMIASFLPYVGVTIRRLHDANMSGWWSCIGVLPYVGGIILYVLLALPSTEGENKFGESAYAPAI